MNEELRQLGWCECGQPIVKIHHSEMPTCRTDGVRFIALGKPDKGWCLFRCPSCSKVVDESWAIGNGSPFIDYETDRDSQKEGE